MNVCDKCQDKQVFRFEVRTETVNTLAANNF